MIPPPEIRRVIPPSARMRAGFAVYGVALAGGQVFIGNTGATERPCSAEETSLVRPGEEILCVSVAPGSVTGPLEVRTDVGGRSFEAITFIVLSGPIVYELRPNPTAPGVPLTIVGDGFDTSDTGGPAATVMFAGAAAPATPTRIRNTTIEVVVPIDATTGSVRVIHPAGDAVSPDVLTIDDGSPIIYDFDHTLIQAGDTLLIFGRHLTGATSVTFAGGAAGTNVSSTDGQISVTVPASADPGPITVNVAAGQAVSTVEVSILEVSSEVLNEDLIFGLGLSPDEQTLYAIENTTPPNLLVIDASLTLAPAPIGVGSFMPTYFAVAPDGTHGLMMNQTEIRTIGIPSGVAVGACPRSPPLASADDFFPPRFDSQSRYAFTRRPTDAPVNEEGYLRIDLLDGSCEYFVTSPALMLQGVQGLLFDPFAGDLLVSAARGHMHVDVATGVPTSPLGQPAFVHAQLFRGLAGPNRIYALGQPGIDVVAVDLFQNRSPEVIQAGTGIGTQTGNGRWLFVGRQANDSAFIDLLEERVARAPIANLRGEIVAAGVSSFFIDTDPSAMEAIRRYTIRD